MDTYILTGRLKGAAMTQIAQQGFSAWREKIGAAAQLSNGRLVELYFAAGDYRMIAMFQFDRGDRARSLSSPIYAAIVNECFEPGVTINSLQSAELMEEWLCEP